MNQPPSRDSAMGWLDLPPRARRIVLWSMITGLVGCALVAIFILLFGEFNRTTGRILGSLGALAFHCGAIVALSGAGDRGLAPWLVRLGVCAFGASFAVMLLQVWYPWTRWEGESVWQTLLFCIALALCVPPARLLRLGRARALSGAALGLIALTLAFWVFLLWYDLPWDPIWYRAASAASVVAFTLSHICLLLGLRFGGSIGIARAIAIWAAGVTGAIWATFIFWEDPSSLGIPEEFLLRLFAASAVADACATLAVLILRRLRRPSASASEGARRITVEIRCPRCNSEQTLPLGRSECRSCGLKIAIDVESDTCIQCGYLLQGLPERRCPECGTSF